MEISVADGKYTVIIDDVTGRITAARHGEKWDRNLVGDNLVYSLAVELHEARKKLSKEVTSVYLSYSVRKDNLDTLTGKLFAPPVNIRGGFTFSGYSWPITSEELSAMIHYIVNTIKKYKHTKDLQIDYADVVILNIIPLQGGGSL